MAHFFRQWLKKAKVNRVELHDSTPTRKAMRFQDLRATGLTWMAVRGDDALKLMQRAGHTNFKTTQLYVREAEAVREGFGEPFPALPTRLLTGARTEIASQIPSQRSQVSESTVGGTGFEPATSGL